MAKQWYFETWNNKWEHVLNIWPDVRIKFGGYGMGWRPSWSFSDSRQAGRVHGMSDYGDAILHSWFDYGWHYWTMQDIYDDDRSRIIVDDYGMMSYTK